MCWYRPKTCGVCTLVISDVASARRHSPFLAGGRLSIRHLQWALWVIGFGLQYLLLSALLAGAWREFPFVLAYVVCLLGTTAGEILFSNRVIGTPEAWTSFFWAAELLRQTSLFSIVVSLIVNVLPKGRQRRMLVRLVITLSVLFWAASLGLNHDADTNAWMTRVVRNISFGSAILDLAAWFALISQPQRDTRRLLIAGGLGLQMTGEALGQSVRQLVPSFTGALSGSLFVVFAHFLCLLIWYQALKRPETPKGVGTSAGQAF